MDEHRIIMRLGAWAPRDEYNQWHRHGHGHGPSFSGYGNQTRHRIRQMDAIIQQLKVEYAELKRIWKQAQKESKICAGSKSWSGTGKDRGMQMEPVTQAGLMRTITGLKQNLFALRRLGHRQIEAVEWSGVAVIEKDVWEIESFLCEFLYAKHRPGKDADAEK